MKRTGYLYERLCERTTLEKAFAEASRGKKNKRYVKPYLNRQDYYIDKLQQWLKNGTLKLSENKHKTIYERSARKAREIVVPKFFPDQVVHWAYCIVMKPVFMKGMYIWNCGSIKGRGVHYGIKKVQKIQSNPKAKYTLKTDFKKYFQSIDIDKLMELLALKIKDKRMLALSEQILKNERNGLPIGYYTSQWFSNFYLERIDHFVKEKLRVPYYIRYVDDLVMWDSNKRRLHGAKRKLDDILRTKHYHITIKNTWQVWRTNTRPLSFLGFTICGQRKRLRRRAWYELNRTVRLVRKRGYCTIHGARSILSRLGWLVRCSGGVRYYSKHIKPIISKGEACKIVSLYDKKKNRRNSTMIIKNGSNITIENHKAKLGLTGDVYLVNNHFLESLESHKKLFPASRATTIEEAENERIAYEQEQERLCLETAAQAELEHEQNASNGEEVQETVEDVPDGNE